MSTATNNENLFSNRQIGLPAMALILFAIGCSGAKDEPGSEPEFDLDADGHIAQQAGGVDCNDSDPESTITTNDYDCDGILNAVDTDADGDGLLAGEECDDLDSESTEMNYTVLSETITNGEGNIIIVITNTYDNGEKRIRSTRDLGGDGNYGDEGDSVTIWTYDDDGNMLSQTIDNNNNGSADWVETWVYDDDGNMLSHNIDNDGDGVADETLTWVYDENGNPISAILDTNGVVNEIFTWAYYENGNLLREATDINGDGLAEYVITYYENGNVLSEEVDENGDGEDVFVITWDEYGNELSQSLDTDGDGVMDVCYNSNSYTFDADGNKLTLDRDSDCDGDTDYQHTWTYDATGNVLEKVQASNSAVLAVYTWTYDENGNMLSSAFDYDGDGRSVDDTVTTWTYDDNDNLLSETTLKTYQTPNPPYELVDNYQRTVWTYDENGNRLSEAYYTGLYEADDGKFDGKFEEDSLEEDDGLSDWGEPRRVSTWTYDESSNMLSEAHDTDGDGNDDSVKTWTYDQEGNILVHSIDSDGNGTFERVATYTTGSSCS